MTDAAEEFDGNLPDDWKQALPEDMRSNGVLDTVKHIETLAKMAIDGRTLATNALRIPSSDASDEDQKAFRDDLMTKLPELMYKPDLDSPESLTQTMKVLGMPDNAEGYELPDMPDPIKDNMLSLSKTAHQAGLTKNQFSTITAGILDDYKSNSEQAYGALEEDRNTLKSEWGAAYNQKVDTIKHFAKQTGFSDEFVDAIANGHIDSSNMKAFDTVIKGYEGESLDIGRQANNPDVKMTPSEADARLNELMSNKDHAYWHAEDPAHKAAVEKVVELGKIADTGEMSEVDKFRQALNGG